MRHKDHKAEKGELSSDMGNNETPVILETKRLILRRFRMDDLDSIYNLVYADPVVKNAWSGAKGTPEEIKKGFAEATIQPQGKFGFRAMVLKEADVVIGLMGFQPYDPEEGEDIRYLWTEDKPNRTVGFDPNYIEVELTYAMGHPYWKKGYATEMGKALIAYGFEELGLGRIIQGVAVRIPIPSILCGGLVSALRIVLTLEVLWALWIIIRSDFKPTYQTDLFEEGVNEWPISRGWITWRPNGS